MSLILCLCIIESIESQGSLASPRPIKSAQKPKPTAPKAMPQKEASSDKTPEKTKIKSTKKKKSGSKKKRDEEDEEDEKPLVQRLELSTKRLSLKPGKQTESPIKSAPVSAPLSEENLVNSSSSEDSGWEDPDAVNLTPMLRLLKDKKWPGKYHRKMPPRFIPKPEKFDTSTTARYHYFYHVHANKCFFSGFLYKRDLVAINPETAQKLKMIYNVSSWDKEGGWTKWWAELMGTKLFLWRVDEPPVSSLTQDATANETQSSDASHSNESQTSPPLKGGALEQPNVVAEAFPEPPKKLMPEATSTAEAIQFEIEPELRVIEELKKRTIPICIDAADCFTEQSIPVLCEQSGLLPPFPYTSNFSVAFDGVDLILFATPSVVSTSSWVAAIRLANYEIAALDSAFSTSVLRISPYINAWADLGLPPFCSKFFSDGLTFYGLLEAKHAFEQEWKEYYCVVTQEKRKVAKTKNKAEKDPQKRKSLFFGAKNGKKDDDSESSKSSDESDAEEEVIRSQVIFYENKIDMKKGQFPRFVIDDINQVHACWPGSPDLVKQDKIELVKVYGNIRIQSTPAPSKKDQKDAKRESKREGKRDNKKDGKRESRFEFHTRDGIRESVLVSKQKDDSEVAGAVEVLSDAKNTRFPPFIYLKSGDTHDSFHWLVSILAAFQLNAAVEEADYHADLWADPPEEWGPLVLQLDELKYISGTEPDLEAFKTFDRLFQDKKMIFHLGLSEDWRKAKKHSSRIRDRHEVLELEYKAKDLIDWTLEADDTVKIPLWIEKEILIIRPPPPPPAIAEPVKKDKQKGTKGKKSLKGKKKAALKAEKENESISEELSSQVPIKEVVPGKSVSKSESGGEEHGSVTMDDEGANVEGSQSKSIASNVHPTQKPREPSMDDSLKAVDVLYGVIEEQEAEDHSDAKQIHESDTSAAATAEKKLKKRRSLLDFFKKSDDELDSDTEHKKAKKDKSKKRDKNRKKDKVDTDQVQKLENANEVSNTQSNTEEVSPSKASYKTETDATSEKDTSGSSPTSSDWKPASSQAASSPESMTPSTASAGSHSEHTEEQSYQSGSPKKSYSPTATGIKTASSVNSKDCAASKKSVDSESKDGGGESPKSEFDLSPGSDSIASDHREGENAAGDAGNIVDYSSSPEMYPSHDNIESGIISDRNESRFKDGKEFVIPRTRKSSRMQDGKLKVIPKVQKDSRMMVDAEGKPLPIMIVDDGIPAEPEPVLEEAILPEVPLESIITIDLSQSLPGDLIFNTFDCTASWIEAERGRAAAHQQWIQAMGQSVRLSIKVTM